jgi:hypothetical protein
LRSADGVRRRSKVEAKVKVEEITSKFFISCSLFYCSKELSIEN